MYKSAKVNENPLKTLEMFAASSVLFFPSPKSVLLYQSLYHVLKKAGKKKKKKSTLIIVVCTENVCLFFCHVSAFKQYLSLFLMFVFYLSHLPH